MSDLKVVMRKDNQMSITRFRLYHNYFFQFLLTTTFLLGKKVPNKAKNRLQT